MDNLNPLALQASDSLVQIAVFVIILGIIWIALRFFLRLARRIFSLGCGIIVLIGVLLLILRYFL
jgi:hypothetical protein